MKKKNCYDVNDVNSAEIPEFVYESLARSLLPVIQKYYESDEGVRRHIVGGANRTLFSVDLPPRLCRTGT